MLSGSAAVSKNWYFKAIAEGKYIPLRRVDNTLFIKTHQAIDSWEEYAREIIWFGKRYSATLLINPREDIRYLED